MFFCLSMMKRNVMAENLEDYHHINLCDASFQQLFGSIRGIQRHDAIHRLKMCIAGRLLRQRRIESEHHRFRTFANGTKELVKSGPAPGVRTALTALLQNPAFLDDLVHYGVLLNLQRLLVLLLAHTGATLPALRVDPHRMVPESVVRETLDVLGNVESGAPVIVWSLHRFATYHLMQWTFRVDAHSTYRNPYEPAAGGDSIADMCWEQLVADNLHRLTYNSTQILRDVTVPSTDMGVFDDDVVYNFMRTNQAGAFLNREVFERIIPNLKNRCIDAAVRARDEALAAAAAAAAVLEEDEETPVRGAGAGAGAGTAAKKKKQPLQQQQQPKKKKKSPEEIAIQNARDNLVRELMKRGTRDDVLSFVSANFDTEHITSEDMRRLRDKFTWRTRAEDRIGDVLYRNWTDAEIYSGYMNLSMADETAQNESFVAKALEDTLVAPFDTYEQYFEAVLRAFYERRTIYVHKVICEFLRIGKGDRRTPRIMEMIRTELTNNRLLIVQKAIFRVVLMVHNSLDVPLPSERFPLIAMKNEGEAKMIYSRLVVTWAPKFYEKIRNFDTSRLVELYDVATADTLKSARARGVDATTLDLQPIFLWTLYYMAENEQKVPQFHVWLASDKLQTSNNAVVLRFLNACNSRHIPTFVCSDSVRFRPETVAAPNWWNDVFVPSVRAQDDATSMDHRAYVALRLYLLCKLIVIKNETDIQLAARMMRSMPVDQHKHVRNHMDNIHVQTFVEVLHPRTRRSPQSVDGLLPVLTPEQLAEVNVEDPVIRFCRNCVYAALLESMMARRNREAGKEAPVTISVDSPEVAVPIGLTEDFPLHVAFMREIVRRIYEFYRYRREEYERVRTVDPDVLTNLLVELLIAFLQWGCSHDTSTIGTAEDRFGPVIPQYVAHTLAERVTV